MEKISVTVYPATAAPQYQVEVSSFAEIQRLLGGYVEIVAEHPVAGHILVNEERRPLQLPENAMFPELRGDVIHAPEGWDDLPYHTPSPAARPFAVVFFKGDREGDLGTYETEAEARAAAQVWFDQVERAGCVGYEIVYKGAVICSDFYHGGGASC